MTRRPAAKTRHRRTGAAARGRPNGAANGRANGQAASPSPNGCNGGLPAPPPQAAADGREAGTGRFAAGNPGGPGNPFARQVAARRQALLDAVGPEDVAQVARKLHELALAGDVPAAKVLLAYVVGKPAQAVHPDRLDLDEVKLLLESPLGTEVLTHAAFGAPLGAAKQILELMAQTTTATEVLKMREGRAEQRALATHIEEKLAARARKS
jgi:hypothetical protein